MNERGVEERNTDIASVAAVGAALGSPSRAAIMCALMSGRAHTSRELADHLDLAASTMSEHLDVLRSAGLVVDDRQGRHRYVRIAGPEVAELIERLGVAVTAVPEVPGPRLPARLRYARSCYDHLAGTLAVAFVDHATSTGMIKDDDGHLMFTDHGRAVLADAGLEIGAASDRPRRRAALRPCLDWSERRHHVAGSQAAELLTAMRNEGWLVPVRSEPRALRLTEVGRRGFADHLGMTAP